MMFSKVFSRTKAGILLVAALGFSLQAWSAGAVRIDFAVGDGLAINATGGQRALSKGASIISGETVRTGEGRAQLRFDDGAMISLQPNSEFRIDNYQYSAPVDGNERGFFSLLKGGLRTITGLIGRTNKENYKVTTSVATIGIRGTEYTLEYLDSETLALSTGEGAIEVCNGGGCSVLVGGESAVVKGPNGALQQQSFHSFLMPGQLGGQLSPNFSTGDFRNPDGTIRTPGTVNCNGGYGDYIQYVAGCYR